MALSVIQMLEDVRRCAHFCLKGGSYASIVNERTMAEKTAALKTARSGHLHVNFVRLQTLSLAAGWQAILQPPGHIR